MGRGPASKRNNWPITSTAANVAVRRQRPPEESQTACDQNEGERYESDQVAKVDRSQRGRRVPAPPRRIPEALGPVAVADVAVAPAREGGDGEAGGECTQLSGEHAGVATSAGGRLRSAPARSRSARERVPARARVPQAESASVRDPRAPGNASVASVVSALPSAAACASAASCPAD